MATIMEMIVPIRKARLVNRQPRYGCWAGLSATGINGNRVRDGFAHAGRVQPKVTRCGLSMSSGGLLLYESTCSAVLRPQAPPSLRKSSQPLHPCNCGCVLGILRKHGCPLHSGGIVSVIREVNPAQRSTSVVG